jgi:hypothetical protein
MTNSAQPVYAMKIFISQSVVKLDDRKVYVYQEQLPARPKQGQYLISYTNVSQEANYLNPHITTKMFSVTCYIIFNKISVI